MDRKRAHQKILLKQLSELEKFSSPMRLAAEEWETPYQILIATIMSARTRDEKTIPTAIKLFRKYPTAKKMANANPKDVQKIIRPVNFYRNKTKNIINCSKELIRNYNGEPSLDFDKLLELPGVGRKTANVFLAEMGKDAIGIDTHVFYIARKLGWSKSNKPEGVEEDLKKLFSKSYWGKVNGILVRFGKTYISRRKKDELLKKIRAI